MGTKRCEKPASPNVAGVLVIRGEAQLREDAIGAPDPATPGRRSSSSVVMGDVAHSWVNLARGAPDWQRPRGSADSRGKKIEILPVISSQGLRIGRISMQPPSSNPGHVSVSSPACAKSRASTTVKPITMSLVSA